MHSKSGNMFYAGHVVDPGVETRCNSGDETVCICHTTGMVQFLVVSYDTNVRLVFHYAVAVTKSCSNF